MTRKRTKPVAEDPGRRLLGVCRHRGPACWPCVALDMERQRDAAEDALRRLCEHAPDPKWVLEHALDEGADPVSMIDAASHEYRAALVHARALLSGGADPDPETTGNDASRRK